MIVASSDCKCKGFNITNGANSNNATACDAATFLLVRSIRRRPGLDRAVQRQVRPLTGQCGAGRQPRVPWRLCASLLAPAAVLAAATPSVQIARRSVSKKPIPAEHSVRVVA